MLIKKELKIKELDYNEEEYEYDAADDVDQEYINEETHYLQEQLRLSRRSRW